MFIYMLTNKLSVIYYPILLILLSVQVSFAQQNENESSHAQPLPTASTEIVLQDSSERDKSQTYVIANQAFHNNELSLNELRAIFSLRATKWPDGSPITVFVLRDEHETHRQFLLKTLKMLPYQLRRQWDRYIYSGIGQGPSVVESLEEMFEKVKTTPGGIGYIKGGVPSGSVHLVSIR